MKKNYNEKLLSILLTVSLLLSLAACGSAGTAGTTADATEKASDTAKTTEAPAETSAKAPSSEAPASEAPVTEAAPVSATVRFGIMNTSSLYIRIMEKVTETVAADGIEVEMVEFSDPDQLSAKLYEGEIDICIGSSAESYEGDSNWQNTFFPVGYAYNVPFNVYSSKYTSPAEIAGSGEPVGILDMLLHDYQYNPRYQLLLEAAGLIELPNGPKQTLLGGDDRQLVKFVPDMNANMKNDPGQYAAIVVSGVVEGLNLIAADGSAEDPQYWTMLVASKAAIEDPATLDAVEKVVEAFQSQATIDIMTDARSASQPAGWDVDMISQYR